MDIISNIIENIDEYSPVEVGHLVFFIECGLNNDESKKNIIGMMNMPEIFSIFVKNIEKSSIFSFICKFMDIFEPKNQWQQWVFLCILCSQNIPIPEYLEQFAQKINETLSKVPLNCEKKALINILEILKRYIIKNCKDHDIVNQYSSYIYLMPSHPTTYEIGFYLNEDERLLDRAIKEVQILPPTSLSVKALEYMAIFPSEKSLKIFNILFECFRDFQNNTFFLSAFVDYIRSIINFPEFDNEILPILKELILRCCKRSAWRSYACSVGFLLEMAVLIDYKCSGNEWEEFRHNELKEWRLINDKEEEENTEIDTISFSIDSQEDSNKILSEETNADQFSKTFKSGRAASIGIQSTLEDEQQANDDKNLFETLDDELMIDDEILSLDPIPKVKNGKKENHDIFDDIFWSPGEKTDEKNKKDFGNFFDDIKPENNIIPDFAFPDEFQECNKEELGFQAETKEEKDTKVEGFFNAIIEGKKLSENQDSTDESSYSYSSSSENVLSSTKEHPKRNNIPKPDEEIHTEEVDVSLGVETYRNIKEKIKNDIFDEYSEEECSTNDLVEEKPSIEEKQANSFSPFNELIFPVDFSGVAIEGIEADSSKIVELLNDNVWESSTIKPEDFFLGKNSINSEEKAFSYLIGRK